ncbi:MAG: endonuclease/exonuclease/phosphatase family protein [Bacteroidales bacterium]|nr:endonuclease/exonuclease/phosphatase family protein [Bacteroidales bacterium]
MKGILILLCLLLFEYSSSAQSIEDLSFGTDSTFEVMTWNIEWLPKNGQTTIDYLVEIIEALDVDLLAIQEVDNIDVFEQMIESLDAYDGYLESSYFAGLAYIYKPGTIQINDIYEIYTTSPYWSPFPRSPMVMDIDFMNERFIIINNHFKCCGDGILNSSNPDDEETRRYTASNLLKDYIDTNFPNENTIVLGDLNDILSDDAENNVFQMFLDDSENYLFADYEIAFGNESEWSYPSWPSHIDHILITNELFDLFESWGSAIQTIKIDEYLTGGWEEYDQNVSDHRPLALKLSMDSNVGVADFPAASMHFTNYPNPFNSETTFSFVIPDEPAVLEIVNVQGQMVYSEKIPLGKTSIIWDANGLPEGIYFARLRGNSGDLATLKLMIR